MSVPKTKKNNDNLECAFYKCTLYLYKRYFYLKENDTHHKVFEPFVSLGFVKSEKEGVLLYKTSLKDDLQEIMEKTKDYDKFCEENDVLNKKIEMMKIAEKKKNTLSKTLKINPIIYKLKENHPELIVKKNDSVYTITIGTHKFIYDASDKSNVIVHYSCDGATPDLIFVNDNLDLETYLK